MIKLNLIAQDEQEERILAYLQENASETLADKINTRLFFMYSLIYSYILIFVSSFFALIGVSPRGEIIFVFELYHKGKSITTTTCPD